jgi:hypothetical protein
MFAVEAARGVQNLAPEGLHDGAVTRLAGLLKSPTDRVGIHHRGAQGREHGGDGGLPDPDAACQAYEYHVYTMRSNRSVAS